MTAKNCLPFAALLLVAAALPAVAQDCPEPAAFAAVHPRVIPLLSNRKDVWGVIREALTVWRDSSFHARYPPPAPELGPPYLAMETDRAAQFQGQAPSHTTIATTCFLHGRQGRTDYQIALCFTVHEASQRAGGGSIELRWLAGKKGTGERTWSPEAREAPGFVEALSGRIEALLK